MALNQRKYETSWTAILRDNRSFWTRASDALSYPGTSFPVVLVAAIIPHFMPGALTYLDLILFFMLLYFWWLKKYDRTLMFKMPFGSKFKDGNNMGPGKSGQAEGILYLGNTKDSGEEVWFSNSDARTHVLYLGTTGAGKTEGLKSMVTNAMCWASGFVYIDGKADTDLWSSLSSLSRRFGRDDDLLVLNYMTGNSDIKAPSNSMNPFSSGSASYLTNMLVSLMPDAEGDNAMWKERAVALIGTIMPAITWKRDYQDVPLNVTTIRKFLQLNNIVKLSREEALPDHLRQSVKGYLETLPGFADNAWDDEGREKPAGPGQPPIDQTTAHQQHGYLSMQFTRSLQSLGDEYGYIFDAEYADVNMIDVVLNRRILVVLIPALEKSGDEIANLGKIVSATLKGMMGSTLGSSVEGDVASVIENKPTQSATPFMTVFDEVGYYAAQGMAVMAAQARSLGFSLIFSGQDLPALEKRVKEEARSITANCNIKIFGKLEDPTQTKEFFEKTVGEAFVTELSGLQADNTGFTRTYYDTHQAGVQARKRASYDGLKAYKEGEALICFGDTVVDTQIFYSNPGHAKAMRVTRYMQLPPHDELTLKHASSIAKVRDNLVRKNWTAAKADVAAHVPDIIANLSKGYKKHDTDNMANIDKGILAIVESYAADNPIDMSAPPAAAPAPAAATSSTATPAAQGASPLSSFADKEQALPADDKLAEEARNMEANMREAVAPEEAAAAPAKKAGRERFKPSEETLDVLRKAAKTARSQLVKGGKSREKETEDVGE
ncbi:MAG: TraM recognition domain-containing protein [Pseudobdellovibrionaceae bacterium]